MLLDIPEKIKEFNASIDDTFTKVSIALDQIDIYTKAESISSHVARHLHNLMIAFIKVCAHAINLQHATKWSKRKSHAKNIFFCDDSGLSAALEDFERIAGNLGKIEQSATYIGVNKTHAVVVGVKGDITRVAETTTRTGERAKKIQDGVQVLAEEATRRKESDERANHLDIIRDRLCIEKGKAQDATFSVTTTAQRGLDGTLTWLFEEGSVYHTWRSQGATDDRPFLVKGAPRSGKTTAVAKIVKDIQNQCHGSQRTSVAYHFFSASVQKSSEDKTPLLSALRQMAFQLAEQDNTVAQSLASFLKNNAGYGGDSTETKFDRGTRAEQSQPIVNINEQAKKLWADLKLGAPQTNAVYYLIFEGMESLMDKHEDAVNALLDIVFSLKQQSSSQSAVKVLLSGENKTFENALIGVGDLKHCVVEMDSCNGGDIKVCIDNELSLRRLFPNPSPGSLAQQARDILHKELPDMVQGKYSILFSILEKIEEMVKDKRAELDDLREVLHELKPGNLYEDTIKSLQKKLDPDDIKELNELLKLVVFGGYLFNITQLEAAMVSHGHNRRLHRCPQMLLTSYSTSTPKSSR
jgi:hypothetical protein